MEQLFPYHVVGGKLPLPKLIQFIGRNAICFFVYAFALTIGVLLAFRVMG